MALKNKLEELDRFRQTRTLNIANQRSDSEAKEVITALVSQSGAKVPFLHMEKNSQVHFYLSNSTIMTCPTAKCVQFKKGDDNNEKVHRP